MIVDHLILGEYQTNCYILRAKNQAKDCLIIDTGLNAAKLIDFLEEKRLNPVAVVLTHGHVDHILGLNALCEKFADFKLLIHKDDATMLTSSRLNLSILAGINGKTRPADIMLEDGDLVEYAGIKLVVIHTPGHTPGGICLYSKEENTLFSGDSLFAGSIGRTDIPRGDGELLREVLKQKILTLDDETIVYTGHGPETRIGNEKSLNPFFI